jgi:RNA-directed DNA polymerase
MQPVAAAGTWPIPALETIGDLAGWLAVTPDELEWFADLKDLGSKNRLLALWHYHYRILQKPSGGIRLIEAPKGRLKQMQRRILSGILDRIPAYESSHGFIKGRSIKTFTAPHVGQRVVLRMDLRDFFPSFCGARVQTMFRTMGYPEPVADLLGGICTNAVPRDIWSESTPFIDPSLLRDARTFYARPHLPQGAPTSPALANFGAYRADRRLAGLAQSAGAMYTRYADDLAFSGGEQFNRITGRFVAHAGAILLEEGFTVNFHKTRIMRRGVRQHLTGLVLNRHANVSRSDFDLLKAILTNCIRHGPESQNWASHPQFRAHLEGRIAFVETINSQKGARLRRIFEEIPWP